jgi:hypothetical protein
MDTLQKYQARMKEFCNLDDFNLSERLRKFPEEKHFWNTQCVDAKIQLYRLEKQRKRVESDVTEKVVQDPKTPVILNKKTLEDTVNSNSLVQDIDDKIRDHKFLLEWLELNLKTISFMAQDFKNILTHKQIEEL